MTDWGSLGKSLFLWYTSWGVLNPHERKTEIQKRNHCAHTYNDKGVGEQKESTLQTLVIWELALFQLWFMIDQEINKRGVTTMSRCHQFIKEHLVLNMNSRTSFSFKNWSVPWMTWEYTNATTEIRLTLSTISNSTPTGNLGNHKINKIFKENFWQNSVCSFQGSLAISGAKILAKHRW